MKLTKELKCNWWLIGILVFLIWITFPYLFKVSMSWMGLFGGEFKNFADYGPVGDVYGSLNTLVSSIALCAVAYSTYLQVTSLKETREVNKEQMMEARHAVFSTKFYGLMTYKSEVLKRLIVKDNDSNEHIGYDVFKLFYDQFRNLLENDWKDFDDVEDRYLEREFKSYGKSINNNKEFSDWFSYFLIYAELIKLIRSAKIPRNEKMFFVNIMRNSMSMEEQITLFWIAPFVPRIYPFLKDSGIFSLFYNPIFVPYAKKFYDNSYFNSTKWKQAFDEAKNQTPT